MQYCVCGAGCADEAVFCGMCGTGLDECGSEAPTKALDAPLIDAARQAGLYRQANAPAGR